MVVKVVTFLLKWRQLPKAVLVAVLVFLAALVITTVAHFLYDSQLIVADAPLCPIFVPSARDLMDGRVNNAAVGKQQQS